MLHGLGEILAAVPAAFPAADGVCAALNDGAAAAVERIAETHLSLLEGHGKRDDFEGGAGLIGVRKRLVAPLSGLCFRKDRGGFFLCRGAVREDLRFVVHREEVVGVVIP